MLKKPSISELDATLAHKRELLIPAEQERTILFDHDLSQLIQFSIPAGALKRHTQEIEKNYQNANFLAPGSELANVHLRSRPGSRSVSGAYASSISSGSTLTDGATNEDTLPSEKMQKKDPWEELPPVHCAISERIVAHGRFQVFTLHNDKVTYIKCGDAVQAILPKLRLWRTSLSQFIFPQPIPGRYWRVELFRSTYRIADDLRKALEQSCCFLDQIKAPELEEGSKEEYIESYLDQLIPDINLKDTLVSLNPNNRQQTPELDLSTSEPYGLSSPLFSPLDSADSTLSDSSLDISGHLEPTKYEELFASSSSTLDQIIETFGVEDSDSDSESDPQLPETFSQLTLTRSASQMQLQVSPRTPDQEFQRQLTSPLRRPHSTGNVKPRSPIDTRSAIRMFYTTGASAVAFIGLRHPFARWNNILETDTMTFKSMDDDWMELNETTP